MLMFCPTEVAFGGSKIFPRGIPWGGVPLRTEVTSWWGEGAFLEEGLSGGAGKTSL